MMNFNDPDRQEILRFAQNDRRQSRSRHVILSEAKNLRRGDSSLLEVIVKTRYRTH